MLYCLMLEGQEGFSWCDHLRLAQECERLGFDGLFRSDHFVSTIEPSRRGSLDAWATLAALAASTTRIRLGTLVSPPTFRHPALLAKLVATVDEISEGRAELGMGTGWYAEEHRRIGISLAPPDQRHSILEDHLKVVDQLLRGETVGNDGGRYPVSDWQLLPRPVQSPRPPIIIGGQGRPRLAKLIARYADEYNCDYASAATCSKRFQRVNAALEAEGRDPGTLRRSVFAPCLVASDEHELRDRARQVAAVLGRSPTDILRETTEHGIAGLPEEAAERLAGYAAVGVDRVIFQLLLPNDLEMPALLANEIIPAVESPHRAMGW